MRHLQFDACGHRDRTGHGRTKDQRRNGAQRITRGIGDRAFGHETEASTPAAPAVPRSSAVKRLLNSHVASAIPSGGVMPPIIVAAIGV